MPADRGIDMRTCEFVAPPNLPKLPRMTESAAPVLRAVVAAAKEYESFRHHYETSVRVMIERELGRRREEAIRQELSDHELVLTSHLKLRLLTERFARQGSGRPPQGEELDRLAQDLFEQRLGRPATRRLRNMKGLLAGVRRVVTGQVSSERFVEQIRSVRQEIVQVGYRIRRLADKSGPDRLQVETAHLDAARSFNCVAAAVAAVTSISADLTYEHRQALNELHRSLPMARSQIDAGLAFFNAAAMISRPALVAAQAMDRQRGARRFS